MTAAVAGLTGLCLTRGRRWILPSVLWVQLMAVSRNYLMAHFPSDVLFAVLIGLIAAAIAYAITLLIFRLLEGHADKRLCALLLGFDLPLRLPKLRRPKAAEDFDEDDGDPERIDVSSAFDQIVLENRAEKAGSHDAGTVEEEDDADAESPAPFHLRFSHSAGSYQGKHLK